MLSNKSHQSEKCKSYCLTVILSNLQSGWSQGLREKNKSSKRGAWSDSTMAEYLVFMTKGISNLLIKNNRFWNKSEGPVKNKKISYYVCKRNGQGSVEPLCVMQLRFGPYYKKMKMLALKVGAITQLKSPPKTNLYAFKSDYHWKILLIKPTPYQLGA